MKFLTKAKFTTFNRRYFVVKDILLLWIASREIAKWEKGHKENNCGQVVLTTTQKTQN